LAARFNRVSKVSFETNEVIKKQKEMKQILVALPVIFSLFVLTSCDNERDLNKDDLGDRIIQFRIKALGLVPGTSSESGSDTRLAVEDCEFEDGDEIGLFAVQHKIGDASSNDSLKDNFIHNVKLTYDGASKKWTSDFPIYYPENRETMLFDFYAYYPYKESVDPNGMEISTGVLVNQEGRSALGKSDFMTAFKRNFAFNGGNVVELVFRHHFSLVRLECHTTGTKDLLLFNSVAFFTPEYSVKKFKLIPVATNNANLTYDLTYEGIKLKKMAIGMHPKEKDINFATYEALVIPQTIEKKQSNTAPLFYCFNDKNTSFFYIYPAGVINDEKIELEKSKAYTFIYKQP
jgi:hypothetical protein